jgi:amidophosphoribosyltransferase
MCGLVGMIGPGQVNQSIYEALTVIQHRGQDAAGIMTCEGTRVHLRKDLGLVRDVFHHRHMAQLLGHYGIGHVRYPTAGSDDRAEAQPFYVNSPFGLALAHNGNLTNADTLRDELFREDLRQLNTGSDSEILLNVLAHELRNKVDSGTLKLRPEDVFAAVRDVFKRCRGAYSVVVLIVGYGLLAFRDPNGIRPLVIGQRRPGSPEASVMLASESVALDVLGYQVIGDIDPGEAVFVDLHGNIHREACVPGAQCSPCIFEYVYLARPDSMMDGIAVYKSRLRMGEKLGHRIAEEWPDHDIDVVIPVPDTSRTAALQMANVLDLKYREGFIKNRYIGRTFIMPGQVQRERSIRRKLNAIELEFRGKNVLLVDDSIVRGTTSREIIQMARHAGARRVYFASAAPPVRYPNVYGIDMPAAEELLARERSVEQVAEEIGADRLFYQTLDDLVEAVRFGNPSITRFDTSCFDGTYVTGDITEDYLATVEARRRDDVKQEKESNSLDSTEVASFY